MEDPTVFVPVVVPRYGAPSGYCSLLLLTHPFEYEIEGCWSSTIKLFLVRMVELVGVYVT